jgi:Tfp pilus assembly protein PilF
MPIKFLKENLKKSILIVNLFMFIFSPYLLAADMVGKDNPDGLTGLQEQARLYRNEGLKLQRLGDWGAVLRLYQKAAELDPEYPDVYNDLGVIYEAQGETDRAEENYIQALKIDPYFLGAYSNLALLYENKRDLANAAYYWGKRVELGGPDDPWTLKAQARLEDVRLALSGNPVADLRNNDVVDLMREVTNGKCALKNREISR